MRTGRSRMTDSLDKKNPKRRVIFRIAPYLVVAIIALLGYGYYEFSGKFERDFKGMTGEQVISILGKPWYDERQGHPEVRDVYTLGWYFSIGRQLILDFKDGKVIRQIYGSK